MPETISEDDLKRWEDALADSWPLGDDGCAGTFGRSCPPDIKPEAISYRQARALIAAYREREKWKDLYSMVKDHCQAAEAELRATETERDALKARLERVMASGVER